jgi:hypothetical protein
VRERSTPSAGRWRGLARRAAAAALLSVAALLCAGSATAMAGPGVVMKSQSGVPQPIPGGQIAANADAGGTYTVQESLDDEPKTISLRGMSMRALLSLAGFNPGAVTHVSVVGGDGPLITLTGPQINAGQGLVSDSGGVTRFVKPAGSSGGSASLVTSVGGTPLEIQVGGGGLLSVEVTANPTSAKVGQTVTFEAHVKFAGAASYTYTWTFDDGTGGSGQTTSHSYSYGGDFQVLVQVRGSGGSQCSPSCAGPGKVNVRVIGQERRPQDAQGTPTGSGPGGAGSGGEGTGAGSGSGSGGTGSAGATSGATSRKPPPLRAERPEAHSKFSSDPQSGAGKTIVQGILLQGQGDAIPGSLPGGAPSGSPKPREGVPGVVQQPSQIAASIALALVVIVLGALRERRRVRLRLA